MYYLKADKYMRKIKKMCNILFKMLNKNDLVYKHAAAESKKGTT